MGNYDKLFESGKVGTCTLKNRFALAPAGTHSINMDGSYSKSSIDYYAARAKGGVGLIILEGHKIEHEIEPRPAHVCTAESNLYLSQMIKIADTVHSYGGKICMQLQTEMGREAFGLYSEENRPVSASEIPAFWMPNIMCRPLTVDEIHKITKLFADAALRCKIAGFDMIEVHAHTGYLLDQFMSSCWNHRTDEYGGSLENRMRFTREVMEATRAVVGKDFPISFRFSADAKYPGGRDLKESQEIAKELEKMGADLLHVDAGCYESIYWAAPGGYLGDAPLVDYAAAIKKVVNIPVMAVGSLTPETAEKAIEEGKCDYVAFTRGFLADPEMPNKLYEGRREDVRPCIACNEFCIGHVFSERAVTCAVNATAGNDFDYQITKAEQKRKIIVIGGGVGGMEAARVAALRGHDVTLFEKGSALGGTAKEIAGADFKRRIRELVSWFEIQLEKLGVKVVLNKTVSANDPALKEADKIIVASGGSTLKLCIPGFENTVDVLELHRGNDQIYGDNIAVCGGGLSGCDTALELAQEGKKVTLIEMRKDIAMDANFYTSMCLKDMFKQFGVTVLTEHTVQEITKDAVICKNPAGEIVNIPAECIVSAFGMKAEKDLADELEKKYYDVRVIGDCQHPGRIGDAVRAGFFASRFI